MGKTVKDSSKAVSRLRMAGLRPTRQRVELASVLFKGHDRHVTAESLHEEVVSLGLKISLATVYNTLHQFTRAGLLRQVVVDAARGYFDTNTGPKREAESYARIAAVLKLDPADLLFVSDVTAETDAAKSAGLSALLIDRDTGQGDIASFAEILP